MKYALIVLLALAAPAPVIAQEWQVARERFVFVGTQLSIHVKAEVAGTLNVIRGAPGSVQVAGRASQGFTAAGLADNEELTLTAAGAGPVDYLVSVPEGVWVRVRLPNATLGEAMASHARSRSFTWDAVSRVAHQQLPEWLPPLDESGDALYTAFVRDLAPEFVDLPDLANVRSVSIRLQEGPFQVNAGRPLSVQEGAGDRLEIRPAAPPMDLVITVPPGTRSFRLRADGHTALIVENDSITALCSPMTQQWLSNGRRWLTFNPVDGALECAARPAPRHEG